MSFRTQTNNFIDSFIPADRLADREQRTRSRMFLFSHLFGPFLGNVIPGYLFFIDPSSYGTLTVLAVSITSFWLYPIALRLTGRYETLSYMSIQNLLFAILWGCFFYGGISSPFLPWLVTVPLLAFFYLGATSKSVTAILSQVAVNGIFFVVLYHSVGTESSRVPIADLQVIGIISILSAAIYVSMMALFYAGILDSQSELEVEASLHVATAQELRAAASEADRAGAAKSEFLAKMSHELRTPLNAVIGYSQILLEDADQDSESQVVADLNRIHGAGAHLLSIVNSILDLSKIEAGKMDVHNETVMIDDLVMDPVSKYTAIAAANGNSFDVCIDPATGPIITDSQKLSRIIDTLLANACAFTKNGSVSIGAARFGGVIELVITDTGSGIEPAVLPTLFEDFMQRSDHNASQFAGAGLGLPLAHRLCGLLQGSLAIESKVGVGTRAIVRVPNHPPAPESAAPPEQTLPANLVLEAA